MGMVCFLAHLCGQLLQTQLTFQERYERAISRLALNGDFMQRTLTTETSLIEVKVKVFGL